MRPREAITSKNNNYIRSTSKGRVGPSSGSSSVDIGKKLKEKNESKIPGNPKLSHAIIMVMVKITLNTLLDFTKEETHNKKLNNFFFFGGVGGILVYPKISHTVPWG